jgi:predicted LPLAT superfamily acyltransferase
LARRSPVPVRMLMYKRNDGALTRLLDTLMPGLQQSVIEIGAPESMLRVREAVAAGEVVGILADRAPSDQKMVEVPFLGGMARLPAGPMIVAGVLDAPVLLCWAVRAGPRHYRISLEPFADRVRLERATRQEDLRGWVARYTARLAIACRADPFNWFNFYDFWEGAQDDIHHGVPLESGPAAAAVAGDGDVADGFLPARRIVGAS